MQGSLAQSILLAPRILSAISNRGKICQYSLLSCRKRKVIAYWHTFYCQRFFSEEWDHNLDDILKDENYQEFSDRMLRLPQHGHNVLVIQPFIRNWTKTESGVEVVENNGNTTPQLQLDEAVALIDTLPRWRVAESQLLRVPSFNKTKFFGSGQISKLRNVINDDKTISAVFVSVNILRVKQIIELEAALGVPVLDRYTIVILIFRHHAVTSESKLQVAMAEIPYLRQCIKGIPKGLSDRLCVASFVGGLEPTFIEKRKQLLTQREQKLKKALISLRKHRERLRIKQKSNSFPIIAVVGYTNAGKTSLIKALTGAEKLLPRNQLFATLDVTKHQGLLPCNLKVLFVDTVGFITDIPTELLESFTATLEDAVDSDVIINVWDVSNPDFLKQKEHVLKTLRSLNFGEEVHQKMLEVANKVDRISENDLLKLREAEPSSFFVSTKTGHGMEKMLHGLQKRVLEVTDRFRIKIRVKTGGEEYSWICQEFPIEHMQLDDDSNYSLVTVIITKSQLDIFKHQFLKKH